MRHRYFFCLILSILISVLELFSCQDDPVKSSQTVVIIKADDLGNMTPNWQQFIDLTIKNDIPSSIGIISKSMTDTNTINKVKEYSTLKNTNNQLLFEFWNHGYDHSNSPVYEFNGTGIDYQKDHIKRSQDFFKEKLGLVCTTFSSPYNQSSKVTYSALLSFPEIKVIMCYSKTEKEKLTNWIDPYYKKDISSKENIVLYLKFHSVYDVPVTSVEKFFKATNYARYVVIQIHPNVWDNNDYKDFQQMIDFLKTKNVVFMTPNQYYNSLIN